jgi:hypothetical protein
LHARKARAGPEKGPSRPLHACNPRASGNRRARLTRALESPLSAGAQVHLSQEVIMSTPTLETLYARMQGHTEDILHMCADIQSNLEAQQVLLHRLRRALEARGVSLPEA